MNIAFARHQRPAAAWIDIPFTVRDGVRLYARHYPASVDAVASGHGRRPLVCLAGMTGNGTEFEELALALSQDPALSRDVYAIDCRGRGRSDYDPDWRNYTPFFEMLDVLDFLALGRIHDAAVLGVSRGGMLAMIMAAIRPGAVGAVILNDIGPVIETPGWVRLMGRVGRVPTPKNWTEAARIVGELEKRDFPKLSLEAWGKVARQRFFDRNGAPAPSYDTLISRTFSLTAISSGVPSMWPQFRALCRVPVMVIRGELSDVLSSETVREMESIHPNMQTVTIPDQGHTPLLDKHGPIDAIASFLTGTDEQFEKRHSASGFRAR